MGDKAWPDLNDSDLDEAPEEVTLTESHTLHRNLKRQVEKDIQAAKKSKKNKNRLKDERFKAQKEAKLSILAATRLPDEVLNDLSDEGEDSAEDNAPPVVPSGVHKQFDSDEDEEGDEVDSGINSTITSKISVKVVREIKANVFSSAIQFKQQKLTGTNSNIRRESAKERQLKNEKRAFVRKR